MRGRGLALAAGYRMGQRRAEEQTAQAEAYGQQGAQQTAQAAAPPTEDVTAQIEKLSELHQSGALTDEEFAAAKKKILG